MACLQYSRIIFSAAALLLGTVYPVKGQDAQRNFADCVSRRSSCNPSALTPSQAQAVVEQFLRDSSTPRALPTSEVDAVAQAEHDNNLRNCKLGIGCNRAMLRGSEVDAVAQAEHDNNLRNCRLGIGCDGTMLGLGEPDPKQGPSSPGTDFTKASIRAESGSSSTSVSGVAENGSYYGEGNVNGVPKTVYVNGYTRKDGTYVRGYYRSPPNSNPPRIRSGHK